MHTMLRETAHVSDQVHPQVFVSYAGADTEQVTAITRLLEQEGVTIWRERDCILGGQCWGEEIVHAIAHSRVVMLMCSPHSFQSENVCREVWLTWDYHRRYIPVWIAPVMEIPEGLRYCLAKLHWIDVHSQPPERWLPQLLKALKAAGAETQYATPQPGQAAPAPAGAAAGTDQRTLRFKPGDRPIPGADWELERLLGKGGFGEVWKAHNPQLRGLPPVALKFCLQLDDRSRGLLRHEADMVLRAQQQIHSNGVVPLLHAYLNNDPPCLEYPYIEGGTLVRLLDECRQSAGLLKPAQAQQVVERVAQIVSAAHWATPKLVHRDLKPSNILVERRPDGKIVLRVTDFGIGGLAAQPVLERSRSSSLQENMASVLTGSYSPLYASPQQMRGDKPDPRDDVYALGVIWYQLLIGDLTSSAPTGRRWVDALWRQGMSGAAVDLLSSCFESDPTHRPDDAGMLADLLEKLPHSASTRPADAAIELPLAEAASSPSLEPSSAPPKIKAQPVLTPAQRQSPPQPGTETKPTSPVPRAQRQGAPAVSAQPEPFFGWFTGSRRWVVAGLLGLAGLLGVIRYITTDNGTIRITGTDSRMKVLIDGQEVRIENLGKPITIRTGVHKLLVKRDGLEFKADSFQIWRGEENVLDVTYTSKLAAADRSGAGMPQPAYSPPPGVDQPVGVDPAPLRGVDQPVGVDPVTPPGVDQPVGVDPAAPPGVDLPVAVSPKSELRTETTKPAAGSPAPALSDPECLTTRVGQIKLKRLAAGTFRMGSPDGDWDADEHPQHEVRITRPFYLGVTEVTRGQFRLFVDETGYKTEAEKDGKGGYGWKEEAKKFEQNPRFTWQNPGFEQTDEHPVVDVSWNDAQEFLAWLSQKEGKTYRLPTEAEWEYACRAGTKTAYFSGDDAETLAGFGNIADWTAKEKYPEWITTAARDGYIYTAPVGRFRANAFGLYDMHGNVWEWCQDGADAEYYKRSPVDDPPGPSEASHRVIRGGGWCDAPRDCRSADRRMCEPAYRFVCLGFRLALSQSGR